jgi:hypothetical protein
MKRQEFYEHNVYFLACYPQVWTVNLFSITRITGEQQSTLQHNKNSVFHSRKSELAFSMIKPI